MGFIMPNFKDITFEKEYMSANITLSVYNKRFKRAQEWLDRTFMLKMAPFIPYKTGTYLSKIKARNAAFEGTGVVYTTVPPQRRYLYPGVAPSGKKFHWTNPYTKPFWATYTINTYRTELLNGVKDFVFGRRR